MTNVFRSPFAAARGMTMLAALAVALLAARTQALGQQRGGQAALPGERLEVRWLPSGKLWYRLDLGADRRRFILVDAESGTKGDAFDHARLAGALERAAGREIDAERLPFDSFEPESEGGALRFRAFERRWRCELDDYELSDAGAAEAVRDDGDDGSRDERRRRRRRPGPRRDGKSPDGRYEAFVRDHDLLVRELATGVEHRLTSDASAGDSYARSAQRQRSVELDYEAAEPDPASPDVYWSPDSRRLVAMRTRPGTERLVYLIESAPKDTLQPRLLSYPYLKPGDDLPIRKPHLFEIEGLREIPIDDELFANPWSIDSPRWDSDSSRFLFEFNQRGHQALRIIGVDGRSGEARAIVDESSATFIDYSGKHYFEYLEPSQEIVWMSERDGWNHLYLYDARTGAVKSQITRGDWVVRGVDHVDPEARRIWFRAGGIHPGQDPYYVHYCSVGFDGGDPIVLTQGDGTHSVQFSPDRRFLVDTWSRVDQPPVHELRRSDGSLVCELERADASALIASGWKPPERFVAKGRDGATDIYGIIHRPRDLDPSQKHPVIENIYAGPHGAFVPKAFRAAYGVEELTSLGFVVVQIDGMGTSQRSKRFHDVCWKNLGDAGLPDRIAWIRAAAERNGWIDATRVGIYGGSAGGQSALRALLAHGDFYKAAAADCGCHDNRMDKIWWNEQWMGWPVGPHYEEQSNVTQAHRLQGKLLLIVGELDKNVDPASTMQVVRALIEADKDFDLIVVPGAGHGAGSGRYGRRRRNEFFVRHLLGEERARAISSLASQPSQPAAGAAAAAIRSPRVRL